MGTDPFEDRPNRRVGTRFVQLYLFRGIVFRGLGPVQATYNAIVVMLAVLVSAGAS